MAKNKLYVGNMSYSTSEEELRELFASYGEVSSVNVVLDRITGKSRGFGFVEMSKPEEAQEAIKNLNDHDLGGRKLTVDFARERRND